MIVTRQQALAQGLKYYTGKVCVKHPELQGKRRTVRGRCVECEREINVKYRATHLEKCRERDRKYNQKNPEIRLNNFRKWRYGITSKQFLVVLAAQQNRCGICRTTEPGGGKDKWHVDHDHNAKRVRGILCHKCNLMLGNASDNSEVLENAIHYLREATSIPGGRFAAILEMFS